MNHVPWISAAAALLAGLNLTPVAWAATTMQVGASGKTYASTTVQCAANPSTGLQAPVIEAGLFNPKQNASATVSLNGAPLVQVTASDPSSNVWLVDGSNNVVVALGRKTADRYSYTVSPGNCSLPDMSGNTFSADGTLEYGASGKSYATVVPGCAFNGATGRVQPYVNLFDNGTYLLNVSVNGLPLTQLDGTTRTHTPVFLGAGQNVISAANGYLSTDYFVRDGRDGSCVLQ
ncbi:MAG: hypothetical protein WC809_11780 [Sinimarinibacterium sp.]|jgi:hypothetical protein